MRPEGEVLKGHVAMLLFSALVAGSFSLGVLAANAVSPVALMAARFVLATFVIGAVLAATGGLRAQDFRAPWRYLVLGATFATYFVLMFEGFKTAPPVSAAAVFTLTPILTGIAGWFILRQVTTRRIAVALAIGAVGALWVIFKADLSALLAFDVGRGEAIYFLGCIAHAVYIPLLRRWNRGESALAQTLGVLAGGSVVLVIYGWGPIRATDWGALPSIVWITLGYLVIFSTALSFTLVQVGSMRLPGAKVMAYSYLTPTWVIVWELALGHGAPPMLVMGGIALTLVALWLLLKNEGGDG